MILSSIKSGENQIIKQKNQYLNNAVEIIKNKDFGSIADGKYVVCNDNFYYILTSYITKEITSEISAESHKRFIDLHFIISGEEQIGYADYSNSKVIVENYNFEKDTELYSSVLNESFFIVKKDMFALFYPEDIHRPSIRINNPEPVRKIIFKIKVGG